MIKFSVPFKKHIPFPRMEIGCETVKIISHESKCGINEGYKKAERK